jgi:dUTP pyrophosphatase
MTTLKIKTIDNYPFAFPKYANEGDSGFDLASVEDIIISPQETVLVPTGLFFDIPEGFEIQVRPRSGVSLKTPLRVVNSPGTVDRGYKGEIKVIMQNSSITTSHFINKGDRIAQAVLCPVQPAIIVNVSNVGESSRGEGGFGSTGTSSEEVK